jgi:hypothetical protein
VGVQCIYKQIPGYVCTFAGTVTLYTPFAGTVTVYTQFAGIGTVYTPYLVSLRIVFLLSTGRFSKCFLTFAFVTQIRYALSISPIPFKYSIHLFLFDVVALVRSAEEGCLGVFD